MKQFQILVFLNLFGFLWTQVPTASNAPPTDTTTTSSLTESTTTLSPPTAIPPVATPPGGIPTAPINTTTSQSITTTPLTTTTEPFLCPPTGIHSLPNPSHCQMFFTCINGNMFDGICQDGFLFDVNRGNCEPAGVVDCGGRQRP